MVIILGISLGELTLRLGTHLNCASLAELDDQSLKMQDGSMQALHHGDKELYRAMNKLANETFGREAFLKAAMGRASQWPAFLAAGWLGIRFEGLVIFLPR
ncbi:hypothetical protein DFAR_1260018 [Desulfarculales bacterium]